MSLGIAAPLAVLHNSHKIDEARTPALKGGCSTGKVIILTKRAGLTLPLRPQGNIAASEHPSIDALRAEVQSVLSISKDAIVRADGAGTADKAVA